jgi:hypothetical protein
MKNYLIAVLVLCASNCVAQSHIQYSYDAAGNRTHRAYYPFRPAPPTGQNQSQSPIPSDVQTKYSISAFPTPTSDKINIIIFNLGENDKATLLLYDMQGKEVLVRLAHTKSEQLDMRGLPSGNYFLKVIINEEKASYIIQKIE